MFLSREKSRSKPNKKSTNCTDVVMVGDLVCYTPNIPWSETAGAPPPGGNLLPRKMKILASAEWGATDRMVGIVTAVYYVTAGINKTLTVIDSVQVYWSDGFFGTSQIEDVTLVQNSESIMKR